MSAPDTRNAAYNKTRETGTDTTLRLQVAETLAVESLTTHEVTNRLNHSANAVRPRVNELIRMGCVTRSGTRINPSGHKASVNHLTQAGKRYLAGDINPKIGPTLAELKADIVAASRRYLLDEADRGELALAVMEFDEMCQRLEGER